MKIIIEIQGKITEYDAISCVKKVIEGGRISQNTKKIKHFCWVTRFSTGIKVATRTKRSSKSADSFLVYK